MSAIEEQMQRDLQLNNEYYLADAVNILLERHALMCIQKTTRWLDTGTIEATLETNRYFLDRLQARGPVGASGSDLQVHPWPDVRVNSPVFIHETAEITDSEIGPYVSIGANCRITGSFIEDSIIEADSDISNIALKGSMVGRQVKVEGKGGKDFLKVNIGDDSTVTLE